MYEIYSATRGKDVFLPREALENRRDVNPVAFLEKGLSLPSTAT